MNYSQISTEKLAYLAGIIDGEGSIYIGCYSSNKKTGMPHYQTVINICNTEESLIDWLVLNFGGSRRSYTPNQTPKNSRRKVYSWNVWSKSLEEICQAIFPYIVIKKRELEIMIAIRKTFIPKIPTKTFGQPKTPEDILALRRSLYLELKSLHNRNYHNKPCAVSPSSLR